MVAVTLGREVLTRGVGELGQERVPALELRADLGRQGHHPVGRAPAAAEMGDLLRRVQHAPGLDVADHGDRHRAADVGRVHARVDRALRGRDPADGNRPQPARRAGIGHDGAADQRRGPHQFGHGLDDLLDVALLVGGLGLDGAVEAGPVLGLQLDHRGRLVRVHDGAQCRLVGTLRGRAVQVAQRRAHPLARLVSPGDQVFSRNHLSTPLPANTNCRALPARQWFCFSVRSEVRGPRAGQTPSATHVPRVRSVDSIWCSACPWRGPLQHRPTPVEAPRTVRPRLLRRRHAGGAWRRWRNGRNSCRTIATDRQ